MSQPEVALVAAVLTLDAAAIAAADNLDGHKGFTLNVLPSPFTYWIWGN